MVVAVDVERTPGTERGRARIVREARSLFLDQGFSAVSMQDIADAAAVNKATLYHHFRDKEDLFVSIMAEEFARMAGLVGAAVNRGGTLRDQLHQVAALVFDEGQCDFGRLLGDLRAHVSEAKRSSLLERCETPWDPLADALERAKAAGQVRDLDAQMVARMFFSMLGSQIWWSRTGPGRPGSAGLPPDTVADLLLDGIGINVAVDPV